MLITICTPWFYFFFFNDTATTEIYTLSLHDALPISHLLDLVRTGLARQRHQLMLVLERSEEHTSELQSHSDLVCRLLLEKKKNVAGLPKRMLDQTPISCI